MTIASITLTINSVNVLISVGSIDSTAPIKESITTGKTWTILFITGITFLTAPDIPLAKLSTNCFISASGLPNPAKKFCHDAPKLLNEPSIVSPASFAVVPVIPNSPWITWIAW